MRVSTTLICNARRGWRASFSTSSKSNASLLVINAGSSTLKYKLFALDKNNGCSSKGKSCKNGGNCQKKLGHVGTPVFSGLVELNTTGNGRLVHRCEATHEKQEVRLPLATHRVALEEVVNRFFGDQTQGIRAIGHRVVHGGETFHDASLITPQVINALTANISLAPLHNPANLLGIEVATEVFGTTIPQVGVFDTAFHATMPPEAYTYALPYSLYEQHAVRRYGFHGTSHQYVAQQAAYHLKKPLNQTSLITCHLGNGSSMAAIQHGRCIDTTMGMTPLEGLCMGTRSGDVDPAIHYFLTSHLNMTIQEIDSMLNKKSGLLGICGDSDVRAIQDRIQTQGKDWERAELAMNVYCHRIRKYLGAYLLNLEGSVDALVFTAGIGENSAMIRARVCHNLHLFGIEIEESKNQESTLGAGPIEIQTSRSKIKVLVIPTDEERSIAEQTYAIAIQ